MNCIFFNAEIGIEDGVGPVAAKSANLAFGPLQIITGAVIDLTRYRSVVCAV